MSIKDSDTTATRSLTTFRNGTYHATHDESRGALSTTVVMAICEVTNVSPSEFQLYAYVDPDSLDSLFTPSTDADMRVEIEALGHRIAIRNGGEIAIRPVGTPAPSNAETARAVRSE